jgi:hypothetical protein
MTSAWKVVVVGAAAALCACAGSARVTTLAKRAGYSKQLDRTIVFVETGRVPPKLWESLRVRLVAGLEARGVRAQAVEDGLAHEISQSIADQAKAFGASTVLRLVPIRGQLDGDRLISQYYDGKLFDLATGQLAWGAFVSWSPNGSEGAADVLVNELLSALEAEGLVRTAAQAAIRQRGTPEERPASAAGAKVSARSTSAR